jgi:superfamily II DNA/RNA helicase
VNEESLRGDYSKIRPGDCIVAFSKADIFSIRKQVEQHTPFKCAIIYGQLPPETRSTQARLFNENNSGYDVLVASDAIGMGLNLNIRRIIFHNTLKGGGMNGVYWVDPSSVKQIAGRAGRMSSDYKIGEVSAWQDADLAYVRAVMAWDIPQIQAVGVFPSVEQIELFSSQLTKTLDHDHIDVNDDDSQEKNVLSVPQILVPVPATRKRSTTRRPVFEPQPADLLRLSMIVERFVELSKTDARYFICDYEALLVVSNWLHTIPMSVADK